jgi:microcystin-dependent protein
MTRYERFSGLGAWTTVASAATVDLGAQTSRNIALSGTTGVTSFGSTPTPDNVPFNIRSTGAITITHSANLICPGNANLTLAAGDTFTVVQEATGVWRIITYSLSALPAISGANLTGLAGGTPAGVVAPFAGSSAPSGWLLCSGGTANRTTFAALFAIIGTTYGAGDGSTTFGLPDLRGRTVAGVDNMGGTAANRLTSGGSGISGTILGAAGGAETFTIGISQMPSHNHQLNGSSLSGGSGLYGTWQTNNPNFISTSSVGGGGASNVTQPTIALNYIIKT